MIKKTRNNMLEAFNISLSFDKPVLKNISFKVKKGQVMGLVGKSGAGKSSLLNILAGHLTPNEGEVHIENKKLTDPGELLVPGYEQIKIVSQDYHLDPYHTVEENIREALISLPETEKIKRLRELMKLMKLENIADIKAIEASGGEQQRLSIARAIALKPLVLLLDEPFSNVDAHLRANLFDHIRKLRDEEGMTIIIVSHDGQDVLGLSDFIYFMNNGKLGGRKTPFNAYYNLKHLGNSKLFGIVNQIKFEEEKIRFRPNEFENGDTLSLSYQNSVFLGTYYLNYFLTKNDEQVILSSNLPLNKMKSVNIKKKNFKGKQSFEN